MTRDAIIEAIRSAAVENGGRPLGERAFYTSSGIRRTDLWKAGFARYGEAVEAAGLVPNQLTTARDASEMLVSLALLVRQLRRFPSISDLKTARASSPDFPSYEAYFRLSGGALIRLPRLLLEFCQENEEYRDVADVLGESESTSVRRQQNTPSRSARVVGYVYLAKHGRDFKLGRSNDITRRRREIALLLPEELKHVHYIETDDPDGIEQYWHRRFESRRVRGEWYRLTPDDVAAFKRRRYQ